MERAVVAVEQVYETTAFFIDTYRTNGRLAILKKHVYNVLK